MALAIDCEIHTNGNWETIDVETAIIRKSGSLIRCAECGAPVRAHKKSTNGMSAHIEHLNRFGGCSRSSNYCGIPTANPRAI